MAGEVEKIVRTRRRGFRDIHVGLVTENTTANYTVESIFKLGRGLSAKVSDKFSIEKVYSDDSVEEIIESYEGSEIDLDLNALAPQDRAFIFGQLYKHGFLLKGANSQAKEIALGWRARKSNGKYEFVWYYCGKFGEGLEDNYETQEDKIKTQSASLKGTFYARAKETEIDGKKDNLYSIVVDEENLLAEHTTAKEAIDTWFTKVAEYKAPTEVQATTKKKENNEEKVTVIEEK